jgi:hypothetical protein
MGQGTRVKGRKDFFFEKKKQKTFAYLAAASPGESQPRIQKFFGSFFQKRTAFFRLPCLMGQA